MVMTAQTLAQGYYAASAHAAPERPALLGTVTADVCVIGAGYTGLSAALHLAKAGARVALLEAETIGFAASGRNGGQIHTGHRKDQAELEAWLGQASRPRPVGSVRRGESDGACPCARRMRSIARSRTGLSSPRTTKRPSARSPRTPSILRASTITACARMMDRDRDGAATRHRDLSRGAFRFRWRASAPARLCARARRGSGTGGRGTVRTFARDARSMKTAPA